jgi:hypothetical protein
MLPSSRLWRNCYFCRRAVGKQLQASLGHAQSTKGRRKRVAMEEPAKLSVQRGIAGRGGTASSWHHLLPTERIEAQSAI